MALGDFFRVNMPYGLKVNSNDEWFVFNREHMPLGWNKRRYVNEDEFPVYTKYKGLTEKKILSIIKNPNAIHRDNDGRICQFFFYNDRTNPQSSPEFWNDYFDIIKEFSKFEAQPGFRPFAVSYGL